MSGKIEISKSFYYILSWAWDKHGHQTPQSNNEQETDTWYITLTSTEGIEQQLQQRDVSQSH
jgi:hypothetical protein